MKKLLLLGAGEMQIPIILRANEMNIETFVVDMDSEAPGLKFAKHSEIISTTDKAKVLRYAKNNHIDGILTTSDYPVNVVAYVSNRLNLNGKLSEEVAALCTNKYRQREFLSHHGFKCPRYKLVSDISELEDFNLFPCIIKPIDSSASRGVKRIETYKDLIKEFPISQAYSRSGQVLLEEFIPGKEFSVETLTQNNETHVINITEKLCLGEESGYFVEDTHIQPARISEKLFDEIKSEVINVLSTIGFDNCPSHTELKVNENGIYIIEIACRLGGDYITSDLVPLSTGINMLDNLIHLSLNEPIEIVATENRYALVQFLNTQNYDKCVDFINHHKNVIEKYQIKPKTTKEIRNSLDRLGYIILTAPSVLEVNNILNKIK